MQKYAVSTTELKDIMEITPFFAEDNRGYFVKDYLENKLLENKISYNIKETFYSFSKKGVLRGLHFQYEKMQPKLVRCISGRIYDVVVDLRKDSPTFKKWQAFELNGLNSKSILIPSGFAHGFYALEDSIMSYKCAEEFFPPGDSGIKWNDSDLGIIWPFLEEPVVSDKDSNLQSFKDFLNNYNHFIYH